MLKHVLSIAFVLALTVGLVIYVGCNGQEAEKPADSSDKPADTHTEHAAQPAAADYPLDVCVVSGQKLGSMGDPVVITHEGQEVRFCCGGCVATFNEGPAKYLAKIEQAKAGDSMGGHGGEDHSGHAH